MKKVAVCGYTSNVGRCFLAKYEGQFEFVYIGRTKQADVILDLRTREMSGDIDRLWDCDALINFAAQTDDKTDEAVLDLVNVNVLGGLYLAEAVKKYRIGQMIEISSVSATYTPEDAYYSYYAYSKKNVEELLTLYCKKNGISLCTLQPSAIFGDNAFAAHQSLLYHFMEKVKQSQPIVLYGSYDAPRNYIHVKTLLEVICCVIQKQITGKYMVVDQRNQTLTQIIEDLNRFYHGHSEVVFAPDKADVIGASFEDDGEIYRKTGVTPPDGMYQKLAESAREE
jgi:nucleoside-diphosphate-sugar epimerase